MMSIMMMGMGMVMVMEWVLGLGLESGLESGLELVMEMEMVTVKEKEMVMVMVMVRVMGMEMGMERESGLELDWVVLQYDLIFVAKAGKQKQNDQELNLDKQINKQQIRSSSPFKQLQKSSHKASSTAFSLSCCKVLK